MTNTKWLVATNLTANREKSSRNKSSEKVDKLGVELDLLWLRPELTFPSFDNSQALSTCCRIQRCVSCGGVATTFSLLEAFKVKLPALEGFVPPTDIHVSRGTRLPQSPQWSPNEHHQVAPSDHPSHPIYKPSSCLIMFWHSQNCHRNSKKLSYSFYKETPP